MGGPEGRPGVVTRLLKAHAQVFLRQWGLTPGSPDNHPTAIELLHDHIDRKRQAFAEGDEQRYRSVGSEDYLTPVEIEAGRLLQGTRGDTITDALEVYLAAHKKRDDEKLTKYTRQAFAGLVAVTGDKEIKAFTRHDARRFVDAQLEAGKKTGTIRRRVNVLRAVWASYARESSPGLANPFERLAIAGEGEGEGEDKDERSSFTADQLHTLYTACRKADDDRRWLR